LTSRKPLPFTRGVLGAAPAPAEKAPAPVEAIALEPEFTTPEWETWWLPDPVGRWVDACHVAYGVPKVMAIAAALCAACTVTQGLAEVEVRPGWREPLSLYWLVFSPNRLELQIQRMRRAVKAHAYTEGAQEHLSQLRELEHQHAELTIPMSSGATRDT
jgi:hypothetical protein